MANRKLSELTARVSPALTDLLIIADPTTGYSYKITGTDLKTLLGLSPGVITGTGTTTGSALIVRDLATATLLNVQNNGLICIGNNTPTAFLDIRGGTTSNAALRFRSGSAPTTPNQGDIWYDGTSLKLRTASASAAFLTTAPRVSSATTTTSLAPDADTFDMYILTAQSGALTIANHTGTPQQGQRLIIRVYASTGGAVSFGTAYRASTDLALPSATTTVKTSYYGFMYNATDAKWDLLAKLENV